MKQATGTFTLSLDEVEICAPLPEYVSERNCEMVYGLAPRAFGALLRKRNFPLPVVRIGRQRLVERAAFTAYLRSLGTRFEIEGLGAAGVGVSVKRIDDAMNKLAAEKSAEELQGEMLRDLGYVAPAQAPRRGKR